MLITVRVSSQARKNGIPVVAGIVHGGQAEEGRDLAEAHGPDTAVCVAAHFGGGQLGVPQRDKGQRDQASLGLGPAPLIDHPVVVGLDAQEGELLVLGLGEGLTAEPREGGEAERGLEVVGVHVLEPGLHLVGARSHVLIGDAPHGHLVAGHPDGGVDPEQRSLEVLVVPPVGGEPFGAGHHGELAADEGDLPHRGPHDPGADVVVLLRETIHPHVGRLNYVVVDGDDPGHVGHEAECTAWSDGPSGAAAPHIAVRRPSAGRVPPSDPRVRSR